MQVDSQHCRYFLYFSFKKCSVFTIVCHGKFYFDPLYLVFYMSLENNFYTFDHEFFSTFLHPKFACFIFYKVFLLSCIILVIYCFDLLIVESNSTLSFITDIHSPVYYILLEKLSTENYIIFIESLISIYFIFLLFFSHYWIQFLHCELSLLFHFLGYLYMLIVLEKKFNFIHHTQRALWNQKSFQYLVWLSIFKLLNLPGQGTKQLAPFKSIL